MGLVSLCIKFPNLDTLAFYLVFVMLVPYLLFSSNDYESLKYYLPMLVMAAVTLTEAGKPDLFKNLYPLPPTNVAGFLSKNIINLLAVTGILVQCIRLALQTNNLQLALVTGLIGLAITFPMAQEVLPVFIREGDKWFRSLRIGNTPVTYPGNWHKYFLGFLFAVFLILCEYLLLTMLVPQLMTKTAKNSVLNNLL